METTTLLAIEERSRRTQFVIAVALWLAGTAAAGAIAWRMQHPAAYHSDQTVTAIEQASTMEWSVDATDEPVEVDGALLMPEDMIVGHAPPGGATMMQP